MAGARRVGVGHSAKRIRIGSQEVIAVRQSFGAPRELVVARSGDRTVLQEVWRVAQDEADAAYVDWCDAPGREGYLGYRAAADRADAALDALMGVRPADADAP